MEDSVDTYGVGARNFDEQEETSTLMHTESNPTEWTDEKHSLFLKSMEATFVNQLHNSLHFFGRDVEKNCSKSSNHKHTSICNPSSQFKVLHDGCWSKIDFRRDERELKEDSGIRSANPWIQHYRCLERQPVRKFFTSRAKDRSAMTADQYFANNFQLSSGDSQGSKTEVTDQNFNDEDLEEEKSGRIHEMKRTRTSTDTVSSNDQVVPF